MIRTRTLAGTAEPGVHLTVGEARFLLAALNDGWATKGSMVNSVYCFEEAVQIADKLKQAVLGDDSNRGCSAAAG